MRGLESIEIIAPHPTTIPMGENDENGMEKTD
jgi:hypothetical protein